MHHAIYKMIVKNILEMEDTMKISSENFIISQLNFVFYCMKNEGSERSFGGKFVYLHFLSDFSDV